MTKRHTVSVGHVIVPTSDCLVVVASQVVSGNKAGLRTLFLDPSSVSYPKSIPGCKARGSSEVTSENVLGVFAVGVPLVLLASGGSNVLVVHFSLVLIVRTPPAPLFIPS